MAANKKTETASASVGKSKKKYYALVIKPDDVGGIPENYYPAGSIDLLREVYADVTGPYADTRPILRRLESRMELYELDTMPNMKDVKENFFIQAYYSLIQDLDDLVDEKVDLKKVAIRWGQQIARRSTGTAKTAKDEALDVFDAAREDFGKAVRTFKGSKGGKLGAAWRTSVAGGRTVSAATKFLNNLFGAGKNILDSATADYSTEHADGIVTENGNTLVHSKWLQAQLDTGKIKKLDSLALLKSSKPGPGADAKPQP